MLNQGFTDLDERIRPLAKAHPDYPIFDSQPGAGEVMVPRLIAAFGTHRDRFSNASQVQNFSGIAPVTETKRPQRVDAHALGLLEVPPADVPRMGRPLYPTVRVGPCLLPPATRQGERPPCRFRSLAAKWIRIVYRCWVNRTPYNERVYLDALRRHGSPLVSAMAKATA